MKSFLLLSAIMLCATIFLPACSRNYQGPVISRVGVTGSYTNKDGETIGGGVAADLAYPLPKPVPGGK